MARLLDLGQLSYESAWEIQRGIAEQLIAGEGEETLIFVEHPHVLTLGANFHEENLLFTPERYTEMGVDVVRTDRGGDVTYHGPNQLVIYPIFDVARHGKDLHKWMRDLEETIIRTVGEYGVEGRRFPPHTGVWAGDRKVAAIGVKIKKWVSLHGIALNCSNDLSYFDLIVPCGIVDYGVTSLSRLVRREISTEDAKPKVQRAFEAVFQMKIQ